MKIRKAKKEDLKKIDELFRKEYSKTPYNEKWDKKISLAKIKKYFNNSLIFVAEKEKNVIGFVIGHITLWDRGKVGYIDEVVVDSHFQGKGYGRKLIEFIENKFKSLNAKNVDLMTHPKSKAFKIYKKMNFDKLNDFVYMTKKLK